MKKWVDIDFEIEQVVYLKTDPNQFRRIITAIHLRKGRVTYGLSFAGSETWHDGFELSTEVDALATITQQG